MLKTVRSYEEACRTFRWRIPERYNLAFDVCDRQTMAGADGHRTALIAEAADGTIERYTFHVLRLLSNRLANVLAAGGVGAGDRVALVLGPGVEAAVAVLAVLKMGAIAVPVPPALGLEPLAWRLENSGARAAVADQWAVPAILAAGDRLPALDLLLAVGEAPARGFELWAAMEAASDAFAPAVTAADDPAFIFYPVDAIGRPKGSLHAHRSMPGNLPAVEFALDFFPQFGDVMWTAAEWMSADALLRAVLPAWHHGVPVVARAPAAPGTAGFDAEAALDLMARHGVRVATLPPEALARLTDLAATRAHPMPRALATGPEPLDAALHERVQRVFGVGANEAWGALDFGAAVANNAALMEVRPGSPGRAAPGVTVEAVDDRGRPLRAGDRGILAVSPGAPGGFLGVWGDEAATVARVRNGWILSGVLGARDLDGYIWPEPPPAEDGVMTVAGLRVAAGEVEAALALHPDVAAAAVVWLPDGAAAGGEIKAFVVADGRPGDLGFARELQTFVAARRAAHEIPRRVEFVDTLPVAADGRVRRDELLSRPLRLDAPSSDERWTQPRR